MLMLIKHTWTDDEVITNLNTSNVNVNLMLQSQILLLEHYLNTSNVNVNHLVYTSVLEALSYLNTSNVNVNHIILEI